MLEARARVSQVVDLAWEVLPIDEANRVQDWGAWALRPGRRLPPGNRARRRPTKRGEPNARAALEELDRRWARVLDRALALRIDLEARDGLARIHRWSLARVPESLGSIELRLLAEKGVETW